MTHLSGTLFCYSQRETVVVVGATDGGWLVVAVISRTTVAIEKALSTQFMYRYRRRFNIRNDLARCFQMHSQLLDLHGRVWTQDFPPCLPFVCL